MIEIRLAGTADAEGISQVATDAQAPHAAALPGVFKPPSDACFPPSAIRGLMADPSRLFFVALDDEVVVGYAHAEIQHRPDSAVRYAAIQLYVHQMGVLDAFRGRGIGSQLLGSLRDLASSRTIPRLALDVWRFNARARSFYERHGFDVYQEKLWARTADVVR